MLIEDYLKLAKSSVDNAMNQLLPDAGFEPSSLHEAMRYSALGPGKRLRPLLVFLGGHLGKLDNPFETLAPIAACVELIHAYSLIHDDLPAMDDDDLRRGRPTCHKAFNEAIAILAGDSLLTLAFEILADYEHPVVDARLKVRLIKMLAHAAGTHGMAGGQALDFIMTQKKIGLSELENIHHKKTGALIQVSLLMGALASGLDDEIAIERILEYGRLIGLSFQVQDDILDVVGSTQIMGKPQGSDANKDKVTYPSVVGLEESKSIAKQLTLDAVEALEIFDERAEPLRYLARFITQREY